MSISTAIVFDHRGRTKKGALGPVEVRVTISRAVYYIGTGVRVRKSEFRLGMVVDRPDCKELNDRLVILHRRILEEINRCMDSGVAIDVATIRQRVSMYVGHKDDSNEIESWIAQQIPLLNVTDGTRKHYYTLLMRMKEFGKFGRWADLSVELVLTWDAWLRDQHVPLSDKQVMAGVKSRKLSAGCVYNYHKNLKVLVRRAFSMGVITFNPYECLRGKFSKGDKESVEYLTEDEMQRIRELPLTAGSELAVVRDLFVMQMYTGMAYADLMAFDIANYRQESGRWVARSERIKTGVPFVSVLLAPVVEVLEHYGWKVPQVSNQHYNRELKNIGILAQIDTKLHSHLARHTFATFMLRNGVRIENLAKMLGHTKITMTQRYAKVLAESVKEDFDMIEGKIKTLPTCQS